MEKTQRKFGLSKRELNDGYILETTSLFEEHIVIYITDTTNFLFSVSPTTTCHALFGLARPIQLLLANQLLDLNKLDSELFQFFHSNQNQSILLCLDCFLVNYYWINLIQTKEQRTNEKLYQMSINKFVSFSNQNENDNFFCIISGYIISINIQIKKKIRVSSRLGWVI